MSNQEREALTELVRLRDLKHSDFEAYIAEGRAKELAWRKARAALAAREPGEPLGERPKERRLRLQGTANMDRPIVLAGAEMGDGPYNGEVVEYVDLDSYRRALAVPGAREDTERPDERLRGGLRAVARSHHGMSHDPDVMFRGCDEYMCVNVRALLRNTEQEHN